MTWNQSLLKKAEAFCEAHKMRFTEPRQHVLRIIANSKKPLGAYDILHQLADHISKPKPPTAYRAIDFWREHGFIHRIESLNAYVTCCDSHIHHDTHFLVCDNCSAVTELHHHVNHNEPLPRGFVAKRTFTETHGTCESCAQNN